jgi:hypothetical protein
MIILHENLLDCIYNKRRIKEKRIEEWLNEDGATRTLIKGLYLLCNCLGLLLLYYGQIIILHGNLLDCICVKEKRRI